MKANLTTLALAIAVTAAAGLASAQTSGEKLVITAFAVNMSNIGTGATPRCRFTSTSGPPRGRARVADHDHGREGPGGPVEGAAEAAGEGPVPDPNSAGRDPHNLRLGLQLRYAWEAPLPEGGRRIVLAADRYIGMAEAQQQPRTIDYPFTLFEIRVNKDGEGEGKLAYATKIRFDKDKKVMELENYSSEPVRLKQREGKART